MAERDQKRDQARDQAATFPMRAVERLTGLTAATIRAWERRYEAIEPARTDGNARRYTADHVRRLVLLRKASERGHSIAQLAALDDARLVELADTAARVMDATSESGAGATEVHRVSPLVDDYLALVAALDVRNAMDLLARAATFSPPRQLVFEIVAPIVHEVGARWARAEIGIAHEHVVTAQLRWLLATLTRTEASTVGGVRAVIATPPGERHELGALIGAFLVASRGFEPIYLGTDLPFADLARAAETTKAALVLLSVVTDQDADARRALARGVKKIADAREVWIGLSDQHPLVKSRLEARFFHSYESLDLALRAWAK